MITLRKAKTSDFEAIKKLMKSQKRNVDVLPLDSHLKHLLKSPEGSVFLAFHENTLVGFGTSELDKTSGQLHNCFVHPNFRGKIFDGKKIAEHLIDHRLKYLFRNKATSVKADIPWAEKHELGNYTARGFKKTKEKDIYSITKEAYQQTRRKPCRTRR